MTTWPQSACLDHSCDQVLRTSGYALQGTQWLEFSDEILRQSLLSIPRAWNSRHGCTDSESGRTVCPPLSWSHIIQHYTCSVIFRMIENHNADKAAQWYGQASEVTMLEDRPRQAAEYANKAVRIYLKLKNYDEAVNWVRKALNYYLEAEDNPSLGRLYIGLILIELAREDVVAAQKAFSEGRRFVTLSLLTIDSLGNKFIVTSKTKNYIRWQHCWTASTKWMPTL